MNIIEMLLKTNNLQNIQRGFNNNNFNYGNNNFNINNSQNFNHANMYNSQNYQQNNFNNPIQNNNIFMNNNNGNNNIEYNNNFNPNFNQNFNNNINNYNMSNSYNQNQLSNNYPKLNELLEKAKRALSDKNNINHDLYEKYIQKQSQNPKQKTFTTKLISNTNDPEVTKVTTIQVTSSFTEENVDIKEILSGQEKRTTVRIKGTNFPSKGGETVLNFLESFKIEGVNEKTFYDVVYVPKQEESRHEYFVINFRRPLYIVTFYSKIKDYASKAGLKLKVIWYKKQNNEFIDFLKEKINKNDPAFIRFID